MYPKPYDPEIPYLAFLYERWRMLSTCEEMECTYAHNKEGETVIFLTDGNGSPMARLVTPEDMADWEPCFVKSADLNKAFSEAASDDWRRSHDDFLEESEPALNRLKQYAEFILKQVEKEREDKE